MLKVMWPENICGFKEVQTLYTQISLVCNKSIKLKHTAIVEEVLRDKQSVLNLNATQWVMCVKAGSVDMVKVEVDNVTV